ncbi:MAG: hypothetical protein QM749_11335 [Aquabacterium sp.]
MVAAFFGLHGMLGSCLAQSEKSAPAKPFSTATLAPVSSVDRVEILRAVRAAYETPTQKYLCSSEAPAVQNKVKSKFAQVFSDEILNEFFSTVGLCYALAGAHFDLILDTLEAISQTYTLKLAEPYTLQGATLVEVRFRAMTQGKPGDEGEGNRLPEKDKWKLENRKYRSAGYLGANGFRSLIQGYPTVSSDVWADMDYTKSLTRPKHRR